jgi:hypothetical protein
MQRIELYLVCTILVGGLALGLSSTAQAQEEEGAPGLSALEPAGPFKVTFNENGTATIQVGSGPMMPLTGTLTLDPTAPPGSGRQSLTYLLPEPVITGTVSFTEPGAASSWPLFQDGLTRVWQGRISYTHRRTMVGMYTSCLAEPLLSHSLSSSFVPESAAHASRWGSLCSSD